MLRSVARNQISYHLATMGSLMAKTRVLRDSLYRRRWCLVAAAVSAAWVALAPNVGTSQAVDAPTNWKTRPLVLYQHGDVWEEVAGEDGTGADGTGTELSELGLIAKGVQRVPFQGKTYRVQREGLYRFMTLPTGLRNLISLRDEKSLLPLLMSLSALQVHGNRHDSEDPAAKRKRLIAEPWVCLTCGNMARLASAVLSGEGYQTRLVACSTLEEPNRYNDGHVMFEVDWPAAGRWILVDADMGLLFRDGGQFLSAAEVAQRVKDDQRPEFFVLAQKAAVLDPYFLRSDGYNYALEFRWQWATPEGKWQWYRRVMQHLR